MATFKSAVVRALRTYVQTFIGLLLASGPLNLLGVSTLKALAVAAVPAALAVVHRFLDTTGVQPIPPG